MRTRSLIQLFITITFFILSNNAFGQGSSADILTVYNDIKNINYDVTHIAEVESLTVKKDKGIFAFDKGKFYFSNPVLDQIPYVVFIGAGRFHLTPPNEIERQQIRKFFDSDSVNESFSIAFFQATDSTFKNLSRQLKVISGQIPGQVNDIHQKINRTFLKDRGINFASGVLTDLAAKSGFGHFIAVLEKQAGSYNFPSYVIFTLDRRADEEVGLFQYFPHRVNKPFYTVCSFHQENDNADTAVVKETALSIPHYDINTEIKNRGQAECEAVLSISNAPDSLQLLSLDLFDELKVDSVKNTNGDPVPFIQEEKEAGFTLIFDNSSGTGSNQKVTVYYSGKLFEYLNDGYLLRNNIYWYPRYGYLSPATYDMTFRYPKKMQVVAIGKKETEWQEKDKAASTWVEALPVLSASFAYGYYDSSSFAFNGLPVTIFSNKNRTKNVRERIAGDVISSLYFFQQLLGNYPYRQLNIVETPDRASYGYPGTLFLTDLTFEIELEGVMESLRGHETSHQWWGNLVGWKTYHDQWLSEAFAEYSGAVMNQFLLEDDESFLGVLEGWYNDLIYKGHVGVSIGLRRFGFSKSDLTQSDGLTAGPIWLGQRLGAEYPVDYFINVYEKGAFVLHMLRMMLYDYDRNDDERFWRMLADFVATYKGKRADTNDFKKIVDKHFGEDMQWFFDQWIYGTEIPAYEYSYQISGDDNEKYFVDLDVRQSGVSDEFRAEIPVAVEFAGQVKLVKLITMTGAQKTFKLGPFNSKPGKIILNDTYGVLARVKSK